MNFRGAEWGIDFTLTTETRCEKSLILASNRIQVSRFVSQRNTKNFGVFPLGRRRYQHGWGNLHTCTVYTNLPRYTNLICLDCACKIASLLARFQMRTV